MPIICRTCGSQTPVDQKFCLRCGAQLGGDGEPMGRRGSAPAVLFGLVGAVFVAGVGGFLMMKRSHAPAGDREDPGMAVPAAADTAPDPTAFKPKTDCTSGDDCDKLGHDYAEGAKDFGDVGYDVYARDPAIAFKLYSKACYAFSSGAGCADLGLAWRTGLGTKIDDAQAAASLQRACTADVPAGCYGLAQLYDQGLGVPADRAKALSLLDKACEGDDFDACPVIGQRYETGDGVTKDLAKAAGYYRQACDFGDNALACMSAAAIAESGQGGDEADKDNVVEFYESACRLKTVIGCAKAAALRLPQNLDAAVKDLTAGCQLGDAHECMQLAQRYEKGDGVIADPGQAVSFYSLGCQTGDRDACQSKDRLCGSAAANPGVAAACQAVAK